MSTSENTTIVSFDNALFTASDHNGPWRSDMMGCANELQKLGATVAVSFAMAAPSVEVTSGQFEGVAGSAVIEAIATLGIPSEAKANGRGKRWNMNLVQFEALENYLASAPQIVAVRRNSENELRDVLGLYQYNTNRPRIVEETVTVSLSMGRDCRNRLKELGVAIGTGKSAPNAILALAVQGVKSLSVVVDNSDDSDSDDS